MGRGYYNIHSDFLNLKCMHVPMSCIVCTGDHEVSTVHYTAINNQFFFRGTNDHDFCFASIYSHKINYYQ